LCRTSRLNKKNNPLFIKTTVEKMKIHKKIVALSIINYLIFNTPIKAIAQEKAMSIKNEYSTLKKVMVGNSANLIVPNALPPDLEGEKISFWNKMFFKMYNGKTAPKWLINKLEKEQNAFIEILKKYNVEILRPNVVQPQPNEMSA
jgi:hypothetical protein